MHDLRAQLAPGWTGVNIALMVVLFLISLPLGLLMLAYIIWGRQLGLDLGRPQTLATAGGRLVRAFQAGKASWSAQSGPLPTGRPAANDRSSVSGSRPHEVDDLDPLRPEREALERERNAFEAEKRDFEARRQSVD